MSPEAWVALMALGVALVALRLSVPQTLERQWQRIFKVGLAVLIAGELEEGQSGDSASLRPEWERRVLGVVHWNPISRGLDAKLLDPRVQDLPSPILPGEQALVQTLARLPGPVERFDFLMMRDERALNELLGDPDELGADHDPARVLGPGAGWSELSTWTPSMQQALSRRLADLVLVLDGVDEAFRLALVEALPSLRVLSLPPPLDPPRSEESVSALFSAVEEALTRSSDRVVLIAARAAGERTLGALIEGAGLRDRCLAVFLMGLPSRQPGLAALLASGFDNQQLDTEMKRSIPYFCLADVNPTSPLEPSASSQILPQPPPLTSGRAAVEVVDLGSVDLRALSPRILARGVLFLLAFRLAA